MKRLLTILVVLAMVAGISWAIEFGGSTEVGAAANAEEQKAEVDQEIGIGIGPLQIDIECGLDYDGEIAADYEIGAEVGVSVFTFGGSIEGDDKQALGDITAFIGIAVADVGADVYAELSADTEKDTFQGAEFSAFWNPGPIEIRAGYLLTSEGAGDDNTPEVFDDGGIYGKIKISY